MENIVEQMLASGQLDLSSPPSSAFSSLSDHSAERAQVDQWLAGEFLDEEGPMDFAPNEPHPDHHAAPFDPRLPQHHGVIPWYANQEVISSGVNLGFPLKLTLSTSRVLGYGFASRSRPKPYYILA